MYLHSFPMRLVKAHIYAALRVFAEYKSDVSYYQVTLSPKLSSHFSINSSGKMQDFVISSQPRFRWGKTKSLWYSPPASMTSRLASVTFKMASKVFIEETDKNL